MMDTTENIANYEKNQHQHPMTKNYVMPIIICTAKCALQLLDSVCFCFKISFRKRVMPEK